MKFLHILTLFLMALVAYTSAQRCARSPSCEGARNVGYGSIFCRPFNTWYYDARSRRCRQMRYLGCGGNANRWCTRAECERRYRR